MIATILAAIICGFIGGVLGSMVLHDVLEQKYDRSVEDNVRRQNETDKRLEAIDAQFKACTVALQELTYKFIRERGALWESVNGLWNDYDERQKQAQPQKAEGNVVLRRKSSEKRTRNKQLLLTATAYENARKRAEKEDISINDCINLLTASAIRSDLQVKRKKSAEPKTYRQILVVTPTFEKQIAKSATAQGVSINEYICFALENAEDIQIGESRAKETENSND